MGKIDYREHYAKFVSPLLTNIRNQATELSTSYGEPPILVQIIAQTPEGGVLASSFVSLTRATSNGASWHVSVGFQNWQDLDDHIVWNAPEPEFPALQVPIEVVWYGTTRRGARESVPVSFPSLQLAKDKVEWNGKQLNPDSPALAGAVVRSLIEGILLHATPEAAEQAGRAMGRRWQKGRRIAAHGQGVVFEATDTANPQAPPVALKELKWPKSPTSTAYRRLVREIQVTTELGKAHSGIVKVIDYHLPDESDTSDPYYVMPLAESTLAKAKYLMGNLEGVLSLGCQLADALSVAHAKGVIHRDVKPNNVLLFGEELSPVLADFGICFLKTDDEGRLTKTDADTVGPDDYAAPELSGARPEEVDGRVDIYSLGKVLYHVLSGGRLFPREHFEDERFDLRKTSADPRLDHFYGLLERMVTEVPDSRFVTMDDCKTQITRALENVRRGVPYHPGLYGGQYSAIERYTRVAKALATPHEAARLDAFREEMTLAVESVESHASSAVNDETPPPRDGASQVAMRLGAEHLLAIILPALAANDLEAVQRWADKVATLVDEGSAPGHGRSGEVIAASSVTAFFGAVVVAWHRERFLAFRTVVDRYRRTPGRFHHLDLFGRDQKVAWPRIVESLGQSQLISRYEPRLAKDLDIQLTQSVGLLTLLSLASLPDAQLDTVARGGELSIPLFPGFIPKSVGWPGALGKTFRNDAILERNVAKEVFGRSDVEELRKECRGLTPVIARAMEYVRHQWGAFNEWRFDADPGQDWKKWCGGEPVQG